MDLGGEEHCSAPSRQDPQGAAFPFFPLTEHPEWGAGGGIRPGEPQGGGGAWRGEGADGHRLGQGAWAMGTEKLLADLQLSVAGRLRVR